MHQAARIRGLDVCAEISKTYRRDAFGRVVSSSDGIAKTDYLFDGAEVIQETAHLLSGAEVIQETVGTSTRTYYTRGLGERAVSRHEGAAAPSYYHHDAKL